MTHATPSAISYQQKRINTLRAQSDSHDFFNILTSDQLLGTAEAALPEHRERLFPPTETLSMFLEQTMASDRSCQNIVNNHSVKRVRMGLPPCSVHTGAYCRARKRLPTDFICSLTREIAQRVDDETPSHWLWKGKHVKVVDGTTVTMPDTEANQEEYPKQQGRKEGLGFPICRIVGITSLSSGVLLNAATGKMKGKGADEQTLLRSIQDTFTAGDLVLGDAYYPSYFFIAEMQSRGVDILMEQYGARRRSTDFRLGKKLGAKDHLIEIKKPATCPHWMSLECYTNAPESLTIREFKVKKKIMVTTLHCPKTVTTSELALLYKSRWNIELDIRNIKDTLGMNILSCKSPEMALKEIWIYFLAYNLIRLLMAQSALMHDVLPRQLSFKHCLQLWLSVSIHFVAKEPEMLEQLFQLMAKKKVGNRPGRIEPRAVKRRPKPYPMLMESRAEARENVLKNGHPRKLK